MDPSAIQHLDLTDPVYRGIDEKYSAMVRDSQGFTAYGPEQPLLSIVIPAYNEAKRLPVTLRKIREFFDRYPIPVEILSIVEKSEDATIALSREAVAGDGRFQVIDNLVRRGKGYAVRSGMLRTRGEIVFYTDADLSTPIYEVVNFLSFLLGNPEIDVVIGCRRRAGALELDDQGLARKAAGAVFSRLARLLSGIDVEDSQAGFKAFRRTANREIFSRASVDGFAFDVEVLVLAKRLQYRVHSLPIDWGNDTHSKVNLLTDSFRTIKDILLVNRKVAQRLMALKT